ncbi:NAD(P)/FAD-dependent oxidoreductase [Streptomyces capparidis]
MGALAAAARLATVGHRVTVCERAGTHGGAVGRHTRGGFSFDTGPGLLNLPAVYRDLFIKTGKRTLEDSVELREVDPAIRHLFPDGTSLRLANASRAAVLKELDTAFGAGAGARWSDLLNRARDVWDATRRPLLEEPLGDRAALAADPYNPVRPPWLRRGQPTLAEVARRELRHSGLAALLEEYALRHGLDPRTAPAGAVVLPYMEHSFGTWYVTGGTRALADALFKRCEERRVEFRFGAEVVAVHRKDGRACGVELAGGAHLEADAVVCGVHEAVLARLLDETAAEPSGPVPPGRFSVFCALRGERPADAVHRTVVHSPDRSAQLTALFGERPAPCDRPTVEVLRPDDASAHPEGHEAVTLRVTVPPQGAVDWTAPGVADVYAERVLDAAEEAVPGLRERLLWRHPHTPADTEAATGAPGGGLPAPALAGQGGAFLRADNRSPVAGLYLVGASAHPGGGLPHTGMSGAIVAGLIGTP